MKIKYYNCNTISGYVNTHRIMLFYQSVPRFIALLMLFMHVSATAQETGQSLPFDTLKLGDLGQFNPAGKRSWHIAGDLNTNRNIKGDLTHAPGKGILIYAPQKTKNQVTALPEFGDADLEFDFLLSKGASFKLLVHDGNEIKIADSWMAEQNPVMKAPGLWQQLQVHFKAAVLDKNGKQITPARFEQIILNGQDIAVSSISKISAETGKATGRFAFRGSAFPFAIRNIRYKNYNKAKISLADLHFKVYPGLHKNPDTLATLQPKRTGVTDSISHLVGDRKSQLVIEGQMEIPHDGDFMFKLIAGGGAWFYLNEKLMLYNKGTRDFERAFFGRYTLKKGKYPFRIIYSNSDECLVLEYEGPQIPWQSLTTPASRRFSEHFEPLEYEVTNKPALQRGFMMHEKKVNPYTISVGMPIAANAKAGNNYAYDLKRYNLLAAWHGRFIDVSNMWRERGEKQMAIPLGAKLEFSEKPLIALLKTPDAAWPDSAQTAEGLFSERGYKLNSNGLPVYFYTLDQIKVEDHLTTTADQTGLSREIKVTTNGAADGYLMLAEGKSIRAMHHGGYAIDDSNYYIDNLHTGEAKPVIRKNEGREQLILPLSKLTETLMIKYNIIW